ncbi:MAG: fluoride efflux transporter CrcB [Ponticaulis sp.]|nr:fluoride efflux transporter CrcB [Ponticaulis sp.]|tara:strand:+ start:7715 stop:8098 length:384 start_codon:yes stop_codon:yes gene_type:complete
MFVQHLLLAALGGAIGSAGRFGIGALMLRLMGPGWPWGTFTVNLVGSLVMGLVIGWFAYKGGVSNAQIFLATGVLGGFTTFSAFSLETARMIETKAYTAAALYAGSSVILGVIMVFAGLLIMRKVLA